MAALSGWPGAGSSALELAKDELIVRRQSGTVHSDFGLYRGLPSLWIRFQPPAMPLDPLGPEPFCRLLAQHLGRCLERLPPQPARNRQQQELLVRVSLRPSPFLRY